MKGWRDNKAVRLEFEFTSYKPSEANLYYAMCPLW